MIHRRERLPREQAIRADAALKKFVYAVMKKVPSDFFVHTKGPFWCEVLVPADKVDTVKMAFCHKESHAWRIHVVSVDSRTANAPRKLRRNNKAA
jgi:hypothetical protein